MVAAELVRGLSVGGTPPSNHLAFATPYGCRGARASSVELLAQSASVPLPLRVCRLRGVEAARGSAGRREAQRRGAGGCSRYCTRSDASRWQGWSRHAALAMFVVNIWRRRASERLLPGTSYVRTSRSRRCSSARPGGLACALCQRF
jgi:hypothetical protein